MSGFDFFRAYDPLGFAECHHTVPVSALGAGHRTRLAELSVGGLRAVVGSRK